MPELTYSITFESDWAVSSGHARHDQIDSLVRRDPDGLPYVPGKTVRGMLRDEAMRIASALDTPPAGASAVTTSGVWMKWFRHLWGGSGSHQPHGLIPLDIRSAHVPAAERAALLSDSALVDAAIVVRSNTMIEDATGIAASESLRNTEFGRAGTTLEGTITLADDAWQSEFLVRAAAKALRRLGGNRRRGAGRCAVTIAPGSRTWEGLLEMVGDGSAVEPPPEADTAAAGTAPAETGTQDDQPTNSKWQRFTVDLETIDPVVIPGEILGNAVTCKPLFPGAVLLPQVTSWIGGLAAEALRNGDLIVTDGTPAPNGTRLLPIPLALKEPKVPRSDGSERGLLINEVDGGLVEEDGRPRQLKAAGGFVAEKPGSTVEGEAQILRGTSQRGTTVHATIDPEYQRPGENGLYSYEFLAPRQEFRFEIWARGAAVGKLKAATAATLRTGTARSAEYGTVRMSKPAVAKGRDSVSIRANESTTVWLTSDTIPTGEPTVTALLKDLGTQWGTTVSLDTATGRQAAFARAFRSESWHTRWNLPRPSMVGIGAGSCFRIVTSDDVSAELVERTEIEGIGRRRGEGFGRVICGSSVLAEKSLRAEVASPSVAPTSGSATNGGARLAPWVETVRWSALESLIVDATRASVMAESAPLFNSEEHTRAQVGGLRRVAERLSEPTGEEGARAWIAGVEAAGSASRDWGGAFEVISKLLKESSRDHAVWPRLKAFLTRDRAMRVAACASPPDRECEKRVNRFAAQAYLLAAVARYRLETNGHTEEA
ncbi:MAG TPA: RAMP superfamily CRISPR-associated protein [Actinomycetaceae bacterium]|nr:RAMP superfamily CRISPR-associated protein [Actinomycetaceae bacterium]